MDLYFVLLGVSLGLNLLLGWMFLGFWMQDQEIQSVTITIWPWSWKVVHFGDDPPGDTT